MIDKSPDHGLGYQRKGPLLKLFDSQREVGQLCRETLLQTESAVRQAPVAEFVERHESAPVARIYFLPSVRQEFVNPAKRKRIAAQHDAKAHWLKSLVSRLPRNCGRNVAVCQTVRAKARDCTALRRGLCGCRHQLAVFCQESNVEGQDITWWFEYSTW